MNGEKSHGTKNSVVLAARVASAMIVQSAVIYAETALAMRRSDHAIEMANELDLVPTLKRSDLRLILEQELHATSSRSEKVLRGIFGFDGHILTVQELAKHFNTSADCVQQFVDEALVELRERLCYTGFFDEILRIPRRY